MSLANTTSYDFKNARRISKDQIIGLNSVNEAFAKLISAYFTTLFRILVDVRLKEAKEIVYGDFIKSRPEPDCIWTFQMENSPTNGILEIDPGFALNIVDRLFGGDGNVKRTDRPITKIEQSLLHRVVERLLQMQDQSWLNLSRVTSTLSNFESKPYLIQIAARNEPVLQITLEAVINSDSYLINLCFPVPMLEPLIEAMKDQSWSFMLPKRRENDDQSQIHSLVFQSKIPITVLLGHNKIKMKNFTKLEVGDVLVLDQKINNPLVAQVGKKPKFKVSPGVVNKQSAVKIIDVCTEE